MVFAWLLGILLTSKHPEGDETPAVFVMNGVFWRTDAITRLGRLGCSALASPPESGIQNPDLRPTRELRVLKSIHTAQVEVESSFRSASETLPRRNGLAAFCFAPSSRTVCS